jgi:replicative superfamily II helicase
MLHIECHGNEDGFMLADGSLVDWAELKSPITELNVATRLNLMIAVAACTGGALAKVVRMSDRAPFWGLIGPTESLMPVDLEKAYSALYLTLLSAKSPTKAMEAFDSASEPGVFWRTTSQGLFEKAWARYKKEYCNEKAMEARANRMKDRAKELSIELLPTLAELKDRLHSHEPTAFERFRDTFFMCDLFPEHISRFPIKYVK